MKTSSFFKAPQEGRISIARSMPRGHSCPTYRALAPGPWFKTVDYETYRELYFSQLNKLNPTAVMADLHELAQGHEPILLCWEKLDTPEDWCHRRMVAEWFKTELNIDVPEFSKVPPKLL